MAGASLTTTQAAKRRASQPAAPAPWHAGSATELGRNVQGTTGASLTQTGASTGTPQIHTAPAAAPANTQTADTTVQPFLTDAQKAGLAAWNTKYSDTLAQLGENDTIANETYDQKLAADQFANANNVDMTNQSMAARGLFQSSIRDNALNDLAVTQAQQQLALQTSRDATIFSDQNQRTTLGAQNTAEQMTYNTDAAANAQAVTPTVPTSTGQAGQQAAGAANPPHPSPAAPPAPAGPPVPQPPSVKQKAARVSAPKPPGAKLSFGTGASLTNLRPG